jgi:hypothetical protein
MRNILFIYVFILYLMKLLMASTKHAWRLMVEWVLNYEFWGIWNEVAVACFKALREVKGKTEVRIVRAQTQTMYLLNKIQNLYHLRQLASQENYNQLFTNVIWYYPAYEISN